MKQQINFTLREYIVFVAILGMAFLALAIILYIGSWAGVIVGLIALGIVIFIILSVYGVVLDREQEMQPAEWTDLEPEEAPEWIDGDYDDNDDNPFIDLGPVLPRRE